MDAASSSLFVALAISAVGCIILGMGMPTLPAYIAIIAVMGTTLQNMGLNLLTAHLFVFTFGVASVITPPVAIASYAAAAISEGKPIGTAIQSSRVGAMIFVIPFAFVFNPALTLGAGGAVPGVAEVIPALLFLFSAMWMIGSALIGFDRIALTRLERIAGLAVGISLISGNISLQWVCLAVALALIGRRWAASRAVARQEVA